MRKISHILRIELGLCEIFFRWQSLTTVTRNRKAKVLLFGERKNVIVMKIWKTRCVFFSLPYEVLRFCENVSFFGLELRLGINSTRTRQIERRDCVIL
mgnify:CR=1 FL=1